MDKYTCYQDAINDLNERGYIHDFILFGNDLLWVQQKIFIRSNDFSILEITGQATLVDKLKTWLY